MDVRHSISLAEIAGWQITHEPARHGDIRAGLPALQRGAVWKVRQIEELWDSILRRFPIGAFIVSPCDPTRGLQSFQHQQPDLLEPTHHLLDGQQRATGIALGFMDVWREDSKADSVMSACWIDLGPPPSSRDVLFSFRLVTRAHPWGYGRADGEEGLSQPRIRAALKAFQFANASVHAHSRPEQLPLSLTWPWDSQAPVPVPVLIHALCETGGERDRAKALAWKRLQAMPLMLSGVAQAIDNGGELDTAVRQAYQHMHAQAAAVRSAFEEPESEFAHRLNVVLSHLWDLVRTDTYYRIPLLHMDIGAEHDGIQVNEGDRKDPVELLFVRINSAGTPLTGEELIYSMLKSVWVEAPQVIDRLKHKPASPARIANLCLRVMQARRQRVAFDGSDTKRRIPFVRALEVSEFRRLIRGTEGASYLNELREFVLQDAVHLFDQAWRMLTEDPKGCALPPVLAAELAQRAPDIFFLLLCWLDRLHQTKMQWTDVSAPVRRRTLGFLTALAWFSIDRERSATSIWQNLQSHDAAALPDFFNRTRFARACRLDERHSLGMIPLPKVEEFDDLCRSRILGKQGCADTITSINSKIWEEWNWESTLIDAFARNQRASYRQRLYVKTSDNLDDEIELAAPVREACAHFVNTLWGSRSILLYAQREWLMKWFPGFDPSLPEYMEDKNRPWDYDHIHAQNFLQSPNGNTLRGIPRLVRDWHGSIGNLRAWPLEANRSDGAIEPATKFMDIGDEEWRYGVLDAKIKRAASFINENDFSSTWGACVDAGQPRQYLKDMSGESAHAARRSLMQGIIRRVIALYGEWYVSLKVGDLM